jgi:hypothetical protein
MISCIHTGTRGASKVSDDEPLRIQFCEWLRHQHTANELFLHNILWTARRSIFYAWEYVQLLKQSQLGMGYVRMWVSSPLQRRLLNWSRRRHCPGPVFFTWQVDWSEMLRFSGNCSTGAACASSSEAELVSARWSSSSTVGRMPSSGWTRHVKEGELDFKSRWPPRSPDLTRWVSCWHLKEHVYAVPPSNIEDLVEGLQSGVTRSVPTCLGSFECRGAHCRLPWNGRRLPGTAIVITRRPWFDHLIHHLMVTCILKTKRRRTYVARYFRLFFLSSQTHYGELVREFRFTLCI